MKEIDDKTLYKFYQEISYLLDLCIVNNKQRQALAHKILLLMNQLFMFKLPEQTPDNNLSSDDIIEV